MKWTVILTGTAIACFAAGASVIWVPALTVMGIAIDRSKKETRESK